MGKWKEDSCSSPKQQPQQYDAEFMKILHSHNISKPRKSRIQSKYQLSRTLEDDIILEEKKQQRRNKDIFYKDNKSLFPDNLVVGLSNKLPTYLSIWDNNNGIKIIKKKEECIYEPSPISHPPRKYLPVYRVSVSSNIPQPSPPQIIPHPPLCAKIFYPEYFKSFPTFKKIYIREVDKLINLNQPIPC
jgi:hypothetical protein